MINEAFLENSSKQIMTHFRKRMWKDEKMLDQITCRRSGTKSCKCCAEQLVEYCHSWRSSIATHFTLSTILKMTPVYSEDRCSCFKSGPSMNSMDHLNWGEVRNFRHDCSGSVRMTKMIYLSVTRFITWLKDFGLLAYIKLLIILWIVNAIHE